jgi:hypothetical protein
MRKRDTLKIDDKEITVKEMTVREIIDLANNKDLLGSPDLDMAALKDQAERYLPKFIEGVKVDELLDFAPSDLKELYVKFKEVNAVFFDIARAAGLTQIVEDLKAALQKDFLKLLADS